MKLPCTAIALGLLVCCSPARADVCPADTLSIVDIQNQTGTFGVLAGSHPAGTLSLGSPRQSASSLSDGSIAASAALYSYYMNPASAYGHVVTHGSYKLLGPSSPTPVTFTAKLSLTATGTGLEYYPCPSNDACFVPPGTVRASITEGAANTASYLHATEGSETTAIAVTLSRASGQIFELRLSCEADAGFAGNFWLDQNSNRTADVSGLLSFPDLPPGYSVVSWGCLGGWSNVPLCTAAGDQIVPTTVSDAAGGAIVLWQGGAQLYAQRISAAGAPLWLADGVSLNTAGCAPSWQGIRPFCVVPDGAGGAIVSWIAPSIDLLYAQRISATGALLWTAGGVILCALPGPKYMPTMVSDGAGGAIVTWEDYRAYQSPFNVYAQRVDAEGVVQWNPGGVLLGPATASPQAVGIAEDGAGGAIVSWFADRNNAPLGINVQRVNSLGASQWTTNGVPLCSAPGNRFPAAIVADGSGGAILTWRDSRSGPDGIYVQSVNAQGAPQWAADGILLSTRAFGDPTIISDGAGGAIVSWIDVRTSARHIYAQRVSTAGVSGWPVNGVDLSSDDMYVQPFPTIVADGASGAFVTWTAVSSAASIYVQHINSTGTPKWPGGKVLCASTGPMVPPEDGRFPTISSDGAGGAIITWQDFTNRTNYDIYASRIATNPSDGAFPTVRVIAPNGGETVYPGQLMTIGWSAADDVGVQTVDVYLSRNGSAGPWESLAQGVPNSGSYPWVVAGAASDFAAHVRVDAWDAAGNAGSDMSDAPFAIASGPVPTLVELFRLEDTTNGVAILWSFSDRSSIATLSVQRAASEPGEWIDVPGEPVDEGRVQRLVDYNPARGVTIWYRLAGVLRNGRPLIITPLSIVHAGVTELALERLAPNPVSNSAQVSYALPRAARVRLSLVDVQGREVLLLADTERAAGRHVAVLDVSDLRAGLYFLRLRAGETERQQRFIVVR